MRYREKLNVRATSKATFSISGELWHSENNGVGGWVWFGRGLRRLLFEMRSLCGRLQDLRLPEVL